MSKKHILNFIDCAYGYALIFNELIFNGLNTGVYNTMRFLMICFYFSVERITFNHELINSLPRRCLQINKYYDPK